MADTLKTIFQIRRDTTANWVKNKDVIPAAGEPCMDVDTGIIKWGNGVDSYENLPGSRAAHYEGIRQSSDVDDQAVITRVLAENGIVAKVEDTFTIKTLIAGEKYSYTAYVFDGIVWKAMDGNYSAANVYFPADMTITTPVGVYTQKMIDDNNGSIVHETEGKSLIEGLSSLFAEVKDPTITDPSVTLTASATPSSAEIGTKITKLNWNGTFTSGSYEYGSKSGETKYTDTGTGIGAATWSISNSIDSQTSTSEDGSFTLAADKYITIDTTTSKTYATITWSGEYGDSPRTPVNNVGTEVSGKIVGQKVEGTANINATGYRNSFYYVGDDYTTAIDSTFVRGTTGRGSNTKNFNVNTYAKDGKTKCLTVPGGTKRIMIAVPGTATLSEVKDLDGMGLDVKGNFTSKTVNVEGANGFTASGYTIFDCVNSEGIAATNYVITIA